MKRYVRSDIDDLNNDAEFLIKGGVLKKYIGQSKHVIVPKGVKKIGEYCFSNSDIVEIQLPEGLTHIQDGAFSWCRNIKNVKFPNTLKNLGSFAFSECQSLISVDIPDNVSYIPLGCFNECKNLKHVNLPSRLKSIQFRSFYQCLNLTKINIPDSVTEIGNQAFGYCTNLEKVNMPDIEISKTAFEGCLKLDKTNYRYNYTHKKSNEAKQRKVKHAEYDTIDDWYMSSDGEIDDDKFAENLEKLVRNEFDVSDYFEEPSIQGFEGEDIISIKLHDGSEYYFSFSWSDMQETIYSDGPEAAANYYFNEIKEGIESGSASTDTPTL